MLLIIGGKIVFNIWILPKNDEGRRKLRHQTLSGGGKWQTVLPSHFFTIYGEIDFTICGEIDFGDLTRPRILGLRVALGNTSTIFF